MGPDTGVPEVGRDDVWRKDRRGVSRFFGGERRVASVESHRTDVGADPFDERPQFMGEEVAEPVVFDGNLQAQGTCERGNRGDCLGAGIDVGGEGNCTMAVDLCPEEAPNER